MPDLSIYKNIKGYNDFKNEAENQGLARALTAAQIGATQARGLDGSTDPAAVKIAKELRTSQEARERALEAGDTKAAQMLTDYMNDIVTSHKTDDKGLIRYSMPEQPKYSMPQQQTPTQGAVGAKPRDSDREMYMPEQDEGFFTDDYIDMPLPPAQGGFGGNEQPVAPRFSSATNIQPISGYGEAVGSIAATKKGMEERAKLEQQLQLEPEIKQESAKMQEIGKVEGERENTFTEGLARVPQLQNMVGRLNELGSKATYTLAGRARDTAMRETGMDVPDSAVARAEYISMVDNEILPLLRQTFGAQFTQKEGERLVATLGDPNASPQEKDSRLKAFIRTKMEEVNTQARMSGKEQPFSQDSIDSFVRELGGQKPNARTQVEEKFGKTVSFSSEEEAEAANLPSGTIITINGRKARVQ